MAHEEHTVLVVDDNADTRDGLCAFLRSEGFTAEEAASGAEALAKLRAGLRPCLILVDLMMPEMSGFTFRTEQVADPELARIPVVACSGIADLERYAQLLGAKDYVKKPVDFDQLAVLLHKYCLVH